MKKRLDLLGIDEDDFLFSMDGPKSDSRFEPINALNANETGAEKLKSLVIGHYKRPRFCQSILTDQQEIDEQLVIEDTLSDTEIVEMAGFRRRYAN
ncbi:24318_t:CDS:2 [Entrophospora sp. SA101]|nr:24318_t:CDS:2 [Entrophospora sp. SA101]